MFLRLMVSRMVPKYGVLVVPTMTKHQSLVPENFQEATRTSEVGRDKNRERPVGALLLVWDTANGRLRQCHDGRLI